MIILNQDQINKKIQRMAMEIYEKHSERDKVYFLGINQKGYFLANQIRSELEKLSPLKTDLSRLTISPSDPLSTEVSLEIQASALKKQAVIIVDDVMNSGRTLFYSFKGMANALPASVEVCVLVLRMHKSFPVHVDYYGLRLATTIKQDIEVVFQKEKAIEAKMY